MKTDSLIIDATLGTTLRKLREQKGWSQEEFADRCNIHRTYVSQLERGLKSPTMRLLWTLCECLSIKPSDCLKEVEKVLEGASK